MASLTIRNLDMDIKERLRVLAATHGHSMEEEARIILKRAVSVGGISGTDFWKLSRQLFGGEKSVELELVSHTNDRTVPDFGGEDE